MKTRQAVFHIESRDESRANLSILIELVANVEIPSSPPSLNRNLDGSNVDLLRFGFCCFSVVPLRTAEWTGDVVHLGPGLPVETSFVNVVAAGSATPHNLVVVFEFHTADWAVVLKWLPVAILWGLLSDLSGQGWSICKDLL